MDNLCLSCYRFRRTTPDNNASVIGYCEWKGAVPAWLKYSIEDNNDPYAPKRDVYSSPFKMVTDCDTFLPLKRT